MKKLEKLRLFLDKFWIRKDREVYFISGIVITSIISSYIVSYWHYTDKISAKPKVKIEKKIMSREKEFKRFREADSHSEVTRSDKQYYDVGEETNLEMPELYHNDSAETNEEN